MVDLVTVEKDRIFCDSLLVSKKFGKVHRDVVRIIQKIMKQDAKIKGGKISTLKFTEVEREYRGQKFTAYIMDRKSFSMLVMSFTGSKAQMWKEKFLDAFFEMESRLLQMSVNEKSIEWKQARTQSKIARRAETDIIKDFVEYATSQGSTKAQFYYKHVTNAVYKCLGLIQHKRPRLRDTLDFMELSQLVVAENIAMNSMIKYMSRGEHYKVIFELVKQDLLKYAEIVIMPDSLRRIENK